jgi:hypothetical protein
MTRNAAIATRWGILQRVAAARNLLTVVGIKRTMTVRHPVLASQGQQSMQHQQAAKENEEIIPNVGEQNPRVGDRRFQHDPLRQQS